MVLRQCLYPIILTLSIIEMVLEQNATLSNETLVIVWVSSENAAKVAEKNFKFVHGPSDYFYLDCGISEWIGNTPKSCAGPLPLLLVSAPS